MGDWEKSGGSQQHGGRVGVDFEPGGGLVGFFRPLAMWTAGHFGLWVAVVIIMVLRLLCGVLSFGASVSQCGGGVELDLPEGQHECMAAASYGLGLGAWRWSGFVLVLIWQVCWLTWISPCWAAIEARCQRAAWSVCFSAALEVGRTCVETFFEGLHSYASFGFSCCTSPGGRAGINERGGWTWTCATKPRVGRSHGGGLCRQGGFRWRLWFLVWGGLCRIGEAAHPGPNTSDATWTFGIANPSGLNS